MSPTMVRYRMNVDRQRVSSEAASNLMEVAMTLPYERITEENLTNLANNMAKGSWNIKVKATNDSELLAKRIHVHVAIGEESKLNQLRKPLVAWRYSTEQISEDE